MEVIMLKTNYYLSLTLLLSIPVCAMERPPRLNGAKPAAMPKLVLKAAAKPAPAVANTKSTCNVCFDEKNALEMRKLACGHAFCAECLRENIQTAVKDKKTNALCCFDPSCKKPIEINDLRKIVYDKNTQEQINDIQLREWLIAQANIKHCPTPNCTSSFVNERLDQFTHKCDGCKQEYCGKCLHAHNPNISCQQSEQERNLATDKNAQERANQAWYAAHTKPCPQCGTHIEKNEGCMHMQCTHCKPKPYHFCWNCLGPWINHGNFYRCEYRTSNPLVPQGHAQAPEEQVAPQNAHLFFARDPRGFVNLGRIRPDLNIRIDADFAERFSNLSCEDQGLWTARIDQLLEQGNYLGRMIEHWNTELERIEQFALRIIRYGNTGVGTFSVDINLNRRIENRNLRDQITQWIITQNPQDLIIFSEFRVAEWRCETSLSRERLQEILNQASRHFKNHVDLRQAQPAVVNGYIYQGPNIDTYHVDPPPYEEWELPVHEEAPPVHQEAPPIAPQRVLELDQFALTIVPRRGIQDQEFIRYAHYLRNLVNQIYREQYQLVIHEGLQVIYLRDLNTGRIAQDQVILQRLIDIAHNHFVVNHHQ